MHSKFGDTVTDDQRRSVDGEETGYFSRAVELFATGILFVALLPAFLMVALAAYQPGHALIVRRKHNLYARRAIELFEFNFPAQKMRTREHSSFISDVRYFLVHTCRGDHLPHLINVLHGDLSLLPTGLKASIFGGSSTFQVDLRISGSRAPRR